jgi:hypothetical protein
MDVALVVACEVSRFGAVMMRLPALGHPKSNVFRQRRLWKTVWKIRWGIRDALLIRWNRTKNGAQSGTASL